MKRADIQFSEHPVRWIEDFREKGGKYSIHFNGDTSIVELSFRTLNSTNQLVLHGAVAGWCDEFAQQILGQSASSVERSIAKVSEQLDRPLAPEEVNTLVTAFETVQATRNRLRDHQEKFDILSK